MCDFTFWSSVWFQWSNLFVFMQMLCISCNIYYHCSVIQLEIRNGDASRRSFIYRIVLAIGFPCEVWYCYFKVCREFYWNFDRKSIESIDCCTTVNFCMLILPIHVHVNVFHFLQLLSSKTWRSFICLVIVTSRYFILFIANAKGILYKRRLLIFWVNFLYPATFLWIIILRFVSSFVPLSSQETVTSWMLL